MAKAKAKTKTKAKKPVAKVKAKPKVAAKRPSVPAVQAEVVSKAPPSGCQWVNPYLIVRDVQAAIDFYKNVFGFQVRFTMPGPDGKIVHAELMHNSSLLMLGPENPQQGACAPQGPSPVTLYTYVENVDELVARAGNSGGKVHMPPKDEFWGDRVCLIEDPQGHSWMFATHYKDVSPEEMAPPAQPAT